MNRELTVAQDPGCLRTLRADRPGVAVRWFMVGTPTGSHTMAGRSAMPWWGAMPCYGRWWGAHPGAGGVEPAGQVLAGIHGRLHVLTLEQPFDWPAGAARPSALESIRSRNRPSALESGWLPRPSALEIRCHLFCVGGSAKGMVHCREHDLCCVEILSQTHSHTPLRVALIGSCWPNTTATLWKSTPAPFAFSCTARLGSSTVCLCVDANFDALKLALSPRRRRCSTDFQCSTH